MDTPRVKLEEVPPVSWAAIFAGTVVAVSAHILLTTLGTGLTALIARKVDEENVGKAAAIGTAVAWTVSALLALGLGGYIAGKCARPGDTDAGRTHGFIVWSVTTVTAFALMLLGMGGAVAGAAGLTGRAITAAGTAAAAAAPNLADTARSAAGEFAAEVNVTGAPLSPGAKRRVATALRNVFTSSDPAAKRNEAIQALTAAGVPAQDAPGMVDEWITAYNNTKQEVEAVAKAAADKAKEAASAAAKGGGIASILVFIGFWGGALLSAWAGAAGAQRRWCSKTTPLKTA